MSDKNLDTKLEILSYQMKVIDAKLDKVDGMTTTVTKLVTEMEHIKKEQIDQNVRLDKLEGDQVDNYKTFKYIIVTAIASVLAGIIGGYLL